MRRHLQTLILGSLAFGCDDADSGAGASDAASTDAIAAADLGRGDTGGVDRGSADRGETDGGEPDALGTDAEIGDAAPADALPAADGGTVELPPPEVLGGDDRPAVILTPSDYDGTEPLPLLVLLGGYYNLASDLDGWIGASEYVNDEDFILLLPDGTIDPDDAPFWNATDTCCDYYDSGVDDVAYLRGLIAEAQTRLAVDSSRVVLIGHSNGGFMAYRMACDAGDQVTAVVSMAGSGWLDAANCHPTQPVSVLQVHGSVDDVMPFGGDDEAPGALEMLGRWAERDGCTAGSLTESPTRREFVDDRRADETTESAYACPPGLDVRLWYLQGSDHYPEFSWDYTEAMLGWALNHPRP